MPETEVAKAKPVDEKNKTLQPIHKTDADDENWISIDADDVKNAHAKVTETAASPRLDGTELRKVIAAIVSFLLSGFALHMVHLSMQLY